MAGKSFKAASALVFVLVATVATQSLASLVLNRVELAAGHLRTLSDLVFAKRDVGVEDVIKAYKAYVDLYVMQTELAALSSGGGTDDDLAYQRIRMALHAPGLKLLAENFFQPLHHAQTAGTSLEAEIKRLIEKMKRQL